MTMTQPRATSVRRSVPLWLVIASIAGLSALLIAGYFLFFRQTYAPLYSDLRPATAASIVEELKRQRIPYQLRNGGSEILVPQASFDSVKLSVAGAELPAVGLEGFELFDNSDMGLTDFAQKIKFQRALQGELTRTILLIEGVSEARVHLSLPEKSLFRGDATPAKASVTIRTRSGQPMSAAEIEGIQYLIASAIPELSSQDVVVLNERGEVVSARPVVLEAAKAAAEAAEPIEIRLLALARSVLPGREIALRIETIETPAGATSGHEASLGVEASGAPAGAELLPKANQVKVSLASPTEIAAEDQKRLSEAIQSSGLLPSMASISFTVAPSPVASTVSVASEPARANPAQAVEAAPSVPVLDAEPPADASAAPAAAGGQVRAPDFLLMGGIVAIVLLIAVGLVLARSLRAPRPRLALEDQTRFAERLRSGLAAQQAEASPHVA